jgi:hypothetical protein
VASYRATIKGNVKLSTSQMRKVLHEHSKDFEDKVDRSVRESADMLRDYMQANAPWRDRTGDARRGLFAIPTHEYRAWQIVLGHTVRYGIYLEKYMSERFAIIEPTRATQGQHVIDRMRGLWG